MKIHKLTASFGPLQGETLRLHGGLNMISMPEEEKRTAWCRFAAAMLYGSSEEDASFLYRKGVPAEGRMELTSNGCGITLLRQTERHAEPLQAFSAVYTEGNAPVEEMTGENAGELLTGMPQQAFERSAILFGSSSGPKDAETAIRALLLSGEENTSFNSADGVLAEKQKKLREDLLPAVEEDLRAVEEQLNRREEAARKEEETENALSAVVREGREREEEIAALRKQDREDASARLREARNEVNQRTGEETDALQQLNEARNALRQSRFGEADRSAADREAEEDLQRIRELRKRKHGVMSLLPCVLCLILAAAGALLYESAGQSLPFILLAAAFCVAGVFFLVLRLHQRREAERLQAQIQEILLKYDAAEDGEILNCSEEHRLLIEAVDLAVQRERESSELLEEAVRKLEKLGARTSAQETQALEALENSRDMAARLSEELRARPCPQDISALKSRQEQLLAEKHRLEKEMQSVLLARRILKSSDEEMREEFSPAAEKRAAEYLSCAKDRPEQSILPEGALDAEEGRLRLLVCRLAVSELWLPEGEACPLILNDVLSGLDERRRIEAVRLLREISRDRQLICFTAS